MGCYSFRKHAKKGLIDTAAAFGHPSKIHDPTQSLITVVQIGISQLNYNESGPVFFNHFAEVSLQIA